MGYDKNNIFAKILRKAKFHVKKYLKMTMYLSFQDINPQKKIHALVIIPKGEYIDLDDFNNRASDQEIVALSKGNNRSFKNIRYLNRYMVKGYRALNKFETKMAVKRFHIYTSIYLEEKKLEKWLSDRKNLIETI